MKKIIYVVLLIILTVKLYSKENITPLEEGDYFSCSYNYQNNSLNIYQVNNDEKKIYHSVQGIDHDYDYQISEDKKRIVYFITYNEFPSKAYVYLIDGNIGEIKEVALVNKGARTDRKLKYLITDRVVPEDSMIEPCIIDLSTREEIYIIQWESQKNIQDKYGIDFGYMFYRSLDKDYDFNIYSIREGGYLCGFASFNVKTKKFIEYQDYPKELFNLRISSFEEGLE